LEKKLKQEEEKKSKKTQETLELRKLLQQEAYLKNFKDNNRIILNKLNDRKYQENKENLPILQKPHSAKPSKISLTPINSTKI
jgi:hypothetical protein